MLKAKNMSNHYAVKCSASKSEGFSKLHICLIIANVPVKPLSIYKKSRPFV